MSHFFSPISCVCWRLFISDLVLKHAADLAINSSSLKYVFLSRRRLGRQQCLAGKRWGCYCQALVFHFWISVCVSVSVWNGLFVCVCLSYETKGMLPTSSCWTEIRGIKEVLKENVRGATWAIVLLACCAQENTVHDPVKMAHLWRGYTQTACTAFQGPICNN